MNLGALIWHSMRNRRVSIALTVASIALAVLLLLGVERLRTETRAGFLATISGTDLIVGAPTGSAALLLSSIFHMGSPSNSVRWATYQKIASHPYIKWAIPLSLGDSHRGYAVVGTTSAYFEHLRYGSQQPLRAAGGTLMLGRFDAVLGAQMARALGYQPGDAIVLVHGTGEGSFVQHADLPFRVTGILAPTGTPIDQTAHVSLEGIEAIHAGWQSGTRAGARPQSEPLAENALVPREITAFLLGAKQRARVLELQRAINEYPEEPLLAILPGVALQELWRLVAVAERALMIVAALVLLTGLLGMVTVMLSSLNERRREMAILRSVGARPLHIFSLLAAESTIIGALGALTGLVLLYGALAIVRPLLAARFGLFLSADAPSARELSIVAAAVGLAFLLGLVPAWRAYSNSLADGLAVRT